MQHAHEEVLQVGGDLRPVWEAERLVLDHLEKLEDIGSIERNTAEDKGVQAGPQGIHIGRTPSAKANNAQVIRQYGRGKGTEAVKWWGEGV